MNEKESVKNIILSAEKKSEKIRQPYQTPTLSILEIENINSGGFNLPEANSGELS